METISIRRQGSYLYAKAYRRLVIGGEIAYLVLGAGLGALAAIIFDSAPIGAVVSSLILLNVAMIWALYSLLLWFFKRESRQVIEITNSGIVEIIDGRKRRFVPWAAVTQIEFNATVLAGASIRIRGHFIDITISNQDIVITEPLGIRETHTRLGQIGEIRDLFAEIRTLAPQASLSFNRLARRRYKDDGVS